VSCQTDIFIVGGGPAGLAAAIAARQNGLRVIVAERQQPPIDKACGEGLMPGAVAALRDLGVRFLPGEAIPFRGIRFLDGQSGLATEAAFPHGVGLAVRRTVLHAKLIDRAAETGATMIWGAQVTQLSAESLACDGDEIKSRWIVAADGQQSQLRAWAGLEPKRHGPTRFGFRRHFRLAPWTDFVEVYWGRNCQVAVTPVAPDEIGLAVITRNSGTRLQEALRQIPVLAARVAGAQAITRERGAPCALRRLPKLHRGRFVLIGDAAGSVDPVTGEGLGLAFRQAVSLGDALRCANLRIYREAHERIRLAPHRMSQLILTMDRMSWLRRRALRVLAAEPGLFARMVNGQADRPGPFLLGAMDTLRLGWRLARSEGRS
jgi:flavin-dependent dehydrogenase